MSLLVDEAPDWSAMVTLACDVLAAGIGSDAAVELSCLPPTAARADCEAPFLEMVVELGLPTLPDDSRLLEQLVSEGDFDTLLGLKSLPEIAAAWLRHERAGSSQRDGDPDQWAAHLWFTRSWYDHEALARELALESVRQAETGQELAQIGASILEPLIYDDEAVIHWVEVQAASSDNFRRALAGVWVADDVSPATFDRLQRAAGTSLPNPHRTG